MTLRNAEVTGWGRYMPSLVVTNRDLVDFVDTSEEWIQSRTGIKQRHYSHVSTGEMGWLAAERALAAAGLSAADLDLVILGSTTPDDVCPNTASYIKNKLGASDAAAFDLNSACTSWFYGLTVATDMIKAGTITRALVIGAERLSLAMDWNKRESCCLFGDGAGAVVVQSSSADVGLLSSKLSCVPDSRDYLRIPCWGIRPEVHTGGLHPSLDFDGAAIFKRAIVAMTKDCQQALEAAGMSLADIDLFVPHQANIRIIEGLARRLNFPVEKTVICIDKYANTSAASMPIALYEALDSGRLKPGMTILMATFGAGLSSGAGVLRWGDRVGVEDVSDAAIPPYDQSVRELLSDSFSYHGVVCKSQSVGQ
jgi:3-oxoacyl-[acyl-carrier-protein] synthase-3